MKDFQDYNELSINNIYIFILKCEFFFIPLWHGKDQREIIEDLRWTIKSTRVLSEELSGLGYRVCKSKVATLLTEIGYSLQSNRKTIEGNQHVDRNAQFEHINAKAQSYIKEGNPVISVVAERCDALSLWSVSLRSLSLRSLSLSKCRNVESVEVSKHGYKKEGECWKL